MELGAFRAELHHVDACHRISKQKLVFLPGLGETTGHAFIPNLTRLNLLKLRRTETAETSLDVQCHTESCCGEFCKIAFW